MIVALAGGVGGAKLANGLSKILDHGQLHVVVNTGDDFEHFGLPISPDLDTVTYTLAGLNDTDSGWGLADETWEFMDALERLGGEGWFRLGDRDLATHVMRATFLDKGLTLSDVTTRIACSLGVKHPIIPMSDEKIRTVVETDAGLMPFQVYFVREQCIPVTKQVHYEGASQAAPSKAFVAALEHDDLDAIKICPSNPFLSIAPILALPTIRARLASHNAPVIAVSPIIGGQAVKGPAAKILKELNLDVSASGVARYYADLLDGIVIDAQDAALSRSLSEEGLQVLETGILMKSVHDQIRLARAVVEFSKAIPAKNDGGIRQL